MQEEGGRGAGRQGEENKLFNISLKKILRRREAALCDLNNYVIPNACIHCGSFAYCYQSVNLISLDLDLAPSDPIKQFFTLKKSFCLTFSYPK